MSVERAIEAETDLVGLDRVENPLAVRIVAAHDRDRIGAFALRQNIFEKPELRREVILHRAVIIEMVTAEIGEDAGAEAELIDTALGQSYRRNFRGDVADSRALHLGERRFEIDRLGRGEAVIQCAALREDPDRSNYSGG